MFHSGLAKNNAIEQVEKEVEQTSEVKHLIEFAKASERGLCGSVKEPSSGD